jgi:hypothetical protein
MLAQALWCAKRCSNSDFFVRPKNRWWYKSKYFPDNIIISGGGSGTVQTTQLSNAADLTLLLSIAWVGPIPEKCGGADLDGMGDVSFGDLVILVSQWLQPPDTPSADIAPKSNRDGIVNFLNLAVLAEHWMESCGP